VQNVRGNSWVNRGGLDKDQRIFPSRPKLLQTEPEQTVSRAEASIRPRQDAQLVAQGENLEKDIQTREQRRPERSDHPEGVTHRR
jgi:hypothetical protein